MDQERLKKYYINKNYSNNINNRIIKRNYSRYKKIIMINEVKELLNNVYSSFDFDEKNIEENIKKIDLITSLAAIVKKI